MRLLLIILLIPLINLHAEEKIAGLNIEAPPHQFTIEDFSEINKLNPTWVAVIPYAFMKKGQPEVHYDPDGPQWWGETHEGTEAQIRAAKALGLKVLLKPQVWVHDGSYTGSIEFTNDADWKTFEDTYKNYILSFSKSKLCQSVDAVCIGTELDTLVRHRGDFWPDFIKECRKAFSGKLTYAANWNTTHEATFWGQLDAIGCNAYFPTDPKDPVASWKPHLRYLEDLHKKYGKPIIFPEYGYRSVSNTTSEPWNSPNNRPTDFQAQSNALLQLYEAIWDKPWFHGGFLWKWHFRPREHNLKVGYTVQSKTAAEIVARQHTQKY